MRLHLCGAGSPLSHCRWRLPVPESSLRWRGRFFAGLDQLLDYRTRFQRSPFPCTGQLPECMVAPWRWDRLPGRHRCHRRIFTGQSQGHSPRRNHPGSDYHGNHSSPDHNDHGRISLRAGQLGKFLQLSAGKQFMA